MADRARARGASRSAGADPLSATPAAKAPDDRRELRPRRRASANTSVNASATATNVPGAPCVTVDEPEESAGRTVSRARPTITRNASATRDDPDDVEHVDGPGGHDAHDDRQQHEPHDVVGDRGAEHGACLDTRERAEVAERPAR